MPGPISPQPLEDAIWDAIMALAKLRTRIIKNGDGITLTADQRDEYQNELAQMIRRLANWEVPSA